MNFIGKCEQNANIINIAKCGKMCVVCLLLCVFAVICSVYCS